MLHAHANPAGFQKIDLAETKTLADALAKHSIDCVMHFAALAYVGESVTEPLAYYHNNTAGTVNMLTAMKAAGVKRVLSAAARRRISKAQKKRWAEHHKRMAQAAK